MKRTIIFLLALLLAIAPGAMAWKHSAGSTTNTNNLKSISGAAITVNATDTLKVSLLAITGTSGLLYVRDVSTVNVVGNWFFNGSVQAYGGVDGVANGTITNMASIKNTATVGVKVASDSLIITPEGGFARLMKNVDTCTVYRGQVATIAGTDSITRGESTAGTVIFPPVYSDSITSGSWGWICISGRALFAVTDVSTIVPQGLFEGSSVRGRYACSSTPTNERWMVGYCASSQYRRINAHGDSLAVGYITGFRDAPN